jgi:LEA14-like dessication related protein
MRRRSFLALAALPLLVAGCVTQEEALDPTISLANVKLERVGLLRQDLLFELRVGNPNNFDIPIEGLALQVDIDGALVAEGFSNERTSIPRLAEVSIPVHASADTTTLLERLFALGDRPELRYRMHGFVYVPGLTGSRRMPYDRVGQLSFLPNAPPPRRDAMDPVRLAPQ